MEFSFDINSYSNSYLSQQPQGFNQDPLQTRQSVNPLLVPPVNLQPLAQPETLLPETRTRRNKGNPKRAQVQLTEDDKLVILRCALQRQDSYGATGVSNKQFWKNIAQEALQLLEHPAHTSLGQAIDKLVKERIEELEEEDSSVQEGRDNLTIVLDDWVQVVQAKKQKDNDRAKYKL